MEATGDAVGAVRAWLHGVSGGAVAGVRSLLLRAAQDPPESDRGTRAGRAPPMPEPSERHCSEWLRVRCSAEPNTSALLAGRGVLARLQAPGVGSGGEAPTPSEAVIPAKPNAMARRCVAGASGWQRCGADGNMVGGGGWSERLLWCRCSDPLIAHRESVMEHFGGDP